MSQDNQNRVPQDDSQPAQDQNQGQGDDWQGESRGAKPSTSPELDDADEMDDDDDRDEDSRSDGSPNRRFNIG